MAHIIVLGNEKGGSGKSTTAMHILVALLRSGKSVGVMDLDLRQQSFFRYIENREAYAAQSGKPLGLPFRAAVSLSAEDSKKASEQIEADQFATALASLQSKCDFVIIDCPGAYTYYAQQAHAIADTLITPMNDSLIDFDLLARMDPNTGRVKGPSIYAEMVWKARQARAIDGRNPIDWVVLRNRMSVLNARNKHRVGSALQDLSKRIGFRLVPGFSERVIFRELFLNGLTLLDLPESELTLSHIAARQEVRDLIRALDLPDVTIGF